MTAWGFSGRAITRKITIDKALPFANQKTWAVGEVPFSIWARLLAANYAQLGRAIGGLSGLLRGRGRSGDVPGFRPGASRHGLTGLGRRRSVAFYGVSLGFLCAIESLCSKSRRVQAFEHQVCHCPQDHRAARLGRAFIVFRQTPASLEPLKVRAPLIAPPPAPFHDHEAFLLPRRPLHDSHEALQHPLCPTSQHRRIVRVHAQKAQTRQHLAPLRSQQVRRTSRRGWSCMASSVPSSRQRR